VPQSLAICLDAPMQSWGSHARGTVRDTALEPTKSGIVGLLGAACGMPRHDKPAIAKLAALRMGVRVDREGILERDYHTVQGVPTTSGTGHRTVESHRFYLADALFLVVLEGDADLVDELHGALARPRWPLFLGRKAFLPARPLVAAGTGRFAQPIETVLAEHPWLETQRQVLEAERRKTDRVKLRTVIDCATTAADAQTRHDHPITFDPTHRSYRSRTVRIDRVDLTDAMIQP